MPGAAHNLARRQYTCNTQPNPLPFTPPASCVQFSHNERANPGFLGSIDAVDTSCSLHIPFSEPDRVEPWFWLLGPITLSIDSASQSVSGANLTPSTYMLIGNLLDSCLGPIGMTRNSVDVPGRSLQLFSGPPSHYVKK